MPADMNAEMQRVQQRIAELDQELAGMGGAPAAQAQPPQPAAMEGLLGGGALPLTPEEAGIMQIRAEYGADPGAVAESLQKRMNPNATLRQGGSTPANMQEWAMYQALSDEEKKMYLEMKRGARLQDIGGSRSIIYSGGLGGADVLSSAATEDRAAELRKAREALGAKNAERFAVLRDGRQSRVNTYQGLSSLRDRIADKDLDTGLYTQLKYKVLPTAESDALYSLAFDAAIEKLKFQGRSVSDLDMKGALEAAFGIGRDEEFNLKKIEQILRELESMEVDYGRLRGKFSQEEATAVAQSGGGKSKLGLLSEVEDPKPAAPSKYSEMSPQQRVAEARRRAAARKGGN